MLAQVCPPGRGGVRDFADCLREAWAARGVASALVEGRQAQDGEVPLCERLDALATAHDGRLAVVLHFSGYGYSQRGLCHWLLDELQALKIRRGNRVWLVVVFHELFAGGQMPWRSAFWLAPWQSQVARRLARMADSLWTNTEHHAGWLRDAAQPGAALHVHPVFSNIGEPPATPAWHERQPLAVIFGSAATRARALAGLRAHALALARLGVREIVEAGEGAGAPADLPGLPLRRLGRLAADELGALLASARVGLLDYPARYLGKSGVFAAYAAHGCVVVNTAAPEADTDGLVQGRHYVDPRAPFETADASHAEMGGRLQRWYARHSLPRQADELLDAAQPTPAHDRFEAAAG